MDFLLQPLESPPATLLPNKECHKPSYHLGPQLEKFFDELLYPMLHLLLQSDHQQKRRAGLSYQVCPLHVASHAQVRFLLFLD
ncbi:hypothetical protein [Burkholderia ubonensis]|uniref:hypothetical protein n=1 Tax=Burkholderia ubonensis TaxID=101571 RepID=UPI0012F93AD5|nr:hypothetical protein [Burkholderia ubonensis]